MIRGPVVLTSTEIDAMRRELSAMGLEIRPFRRYGPKRQLVVRLSEDLYHEFEEYLIATYGSFYRGIKSRIIEEALRAYMNS